MKKILLMCLFCCLAKLVLAQDVDGPRTLIIKGIAMDSASSRPLAYVTMVLKDAHTGRQEDNSFTRADGSFEMTMLIGKTYRLTFAYDGYKNRTLRINGTINEIDFGNVFMAPSNTPSKQPLAVSAIVTTMADRICYNVAADTKTATFSALDIIARVPLLSVDATNSVKLNGGTNYKLWVDGKLSVKFTKNLSATLKAMPANNLSKIEVITALPSTPDNAGLSGIINIVTK